MKLLIVLGMPHKALSPNARAHWAAKSKQVKHARIEAKFSAISAMNRAGCKNFPLASATVKATFHFKTNRRRDRDNLQGSLKAVFDGLADAGMVVNDSQFTPLPCEIRVDPTRSTEYVSLEIVGEPAGEVAA